MRLNFVNEWSSWLNPEENQVSSLKSLVATTPASAHGFAKATLDLKDILYFS